MDYQSAIPRWLWDDEGIWPFVKKLTEIPQDPPTWAEADWVSLELQDLVDNWLFGLDGIERYMDEGGSEQWITWARKVMTDEWAVTNVNWKQIRQNLLELRSEQRVVMVIRNVR